MELGLFCIIDIVIPVPASEAILNNTSKSGSSWGPFY